MTESHETSHDDMPDLADWSDSDEEERKLGRVAKQKKNVGRANGGSVYGYS